MHGHTNDWDELVQPLLQRYADNRVEIWTYQAGEKTDCLGTGAKWYSYSFSLVDSPEAALISDLTSLAHVANRTFRDDGILYQGKKELEVCVRKAMRVIDKHIQTYGPY